MIRTFSAAMFAAALSVPVSGHAGETPLAVVSIKPVHSLVAMVMKGVAEPALLLDGHASPHTYALKPSDARKLEEANIVFRIGPDMETFMNQPLETLAETARIVDLANTPKLKTLAYRPPGVFEDHHDESDDHDESHDQDADHDAHATHDHSADDHGHAHGSFDMHIWLDPDNARLMVYRIAAELAAADPARAGLYAANAESAVRALDELEAELAAMLEPVHDKRFIVFHDGYHYFENRFDLDAAGSISLNPQVPPGAETIAELEEMVRQGGVVCAFVEPQFSPRLAEAIAGAATIRIGTLDPIGAAIDPGPDQYAALMRDLARTFAECLTD